MNQPRGMDSRRANAILAIHPRRGRREQLSLRERIEERRAATPCSATAKVLLARRDDTQSDPTCRFDIERITDVAQQCRGRFGEWRSVCRRASIAR
jgi:hypothetical protein